jgi:hypothetical protein
MTSSLKVNQLRLTLTPGNDTDQMVRCSFFEMGMILHPRMLYSMVLLERTIAGFEASMRVIQSHACQVWVFLPFSP